MERVVRYDDETIENINLRFQSVHTVCGVMTELLDYLAYRKDELTDITEDKKLSMETLALLEQLGYPMDQLGTYLYQHLIYKTIKERQRQFEMGNTTDEYILGELQDAFSLHYKQTARGDLDIGVRTFHHKVYETVSNVDYKKADPVLLYEIFGDEKKEMDYGEQALYMASYISKDRIKSKQEEPPKIKKLTTIKYEY